MRLLDPVGAVRLRIAAIGDIGIMGTARARARRDGFDSLFRDVAPGLKDADIAFANLEMPVGDPDWVLPGRAARESWSDEAVPAAIAAAGVRVVSIANNHAMDCGPRGLERTRAACAAAGLLAIGAGRNLDEARQPAHVQVGGRRVTFLAYAASSGDDEAGPDQPGLAPLSIEMMREDIARWRGDCDVLVVSTHWASMYVDYPPPRVTKLARELADAGVDLVLGHHPHVTQGYRRHGRTLVLFSLGDAVFNSYSGDFHASVGHAERMRTGVFTSLIADEPGLDYQPLLLDRDGVPSPADAAEAERQIERLKRISAGLVDADANFNRQSASQLLRYEIEAIGHHLRAGRIDRILKLLGTIRPRHARLLWHAVRRIGRSA